MKESIKLRTPQGTVSISNLIPYLKNNPSLKNVIESNYPLKKWNFQRDGLSNRYLHYEFSQDGLVAEVCQKEFLNLYKCSYRQINRKKVEYKLQMSNDISLVKNEIGYEEELHICQNQNSNSEINVLSDFYAWDKVIFNDFEGTLNLKNLKYVLIKNKHSKKDLIINHNTWIFDDFSIDNSETHNKKIILNAKKIIGNNNIDLTDIYFNEYEELYIESKNLVLTGIIDYIGHEKPLILKGKYVYIHQQDNHSSSGVNIECEDLCYRVDNHGTHNYYDIYGDIKTNRLQLESGPAFKKYMIMHLKCNEIEYKINSSGDLSEITIYNLEPLNPELPIKIKKDSGTSYGNLVTVFYLPRKIKDKYKFEIDYKSRVDIKWV